MGLQRFKKHVADSVVNAQNASLDSMNPDQLLDLFELSPATATPSAAVPHTRPSEKEAFQARACWSTTCCSTARSAPGSGVLNAKPMAKVASISAGGGSAPHRRHRCRTTTSGAPSQVNIPVTPEYTAVVPVTHTCNTIPVTQIPVTQRPRLTVLRRMGCPRHLHRGKFTDHPG